jgi:hypothetical protein
MVEPHAALAVGLHVLEVAAAAAPLPLTMLWITAVRMAPRLRGT